MRTYEFSLVPGEASTSAVPTSSVAQTGDDIENSGKKRKASRSGAEHDILVSDRTSTSVVPTPPGVHTGGSSEVAGDERRPTSPSSNTHLPLWFQTTFNKMLDLFELHIKREMGKLHEEHILGLTEGYHYQAAELRAEQAEKSARQAEEKNLHLQSQLLQAEQRAKAAEILVQQVKSQRGGDGGLQERNANDSVENVREEVKVESGRAEVKLERD